MRVVISIVAGYLLGCISMGILMGKLFAKMDIRTRGSGNAGATNMLRTLGWVPSLLTFAGDALKGIAACLIGRLLLGQKGAYIAGIACICGHNWPVFFNFKGGKGVSTSFGVLLFTCPIIAFSVLALQIIIVTLTKTMSIASVCSGLLNALMSLILFIGQPFRMICGFIITALLLYCHRENIVRLLQNRENRLDFKAIAKLRKDGKGK